MCLWSGLKIRFGESISRDFVLNLLYLRPVFGVKGTHPKGFDPEGILFYSETHSEQLAGVVEVSDGKHKGDVEEEVAPVCLSSFGKQVVEELDQVEDEGHHNPDKGQRRPVGMVGNGGEIQEKGSDIRPHIK